MRSSTKLWAGVAMMAFGTGIAVAQVEATKLAPATEPAKQTTGVATKGDGGKDPVLERVLTAWPAGRIDTVKHPGEWRRPWTGPSTRTV
jgi:hypothetical protein